MRAFLFNRQQTEVYEFVDQTTLYMECREDEVTTYLHTFGGEGVNDGIIPPGCTKPVHLFFDLDLSDPRVGVTRPGPYITHMPLYYALGNRGGPFRYRVVHDGSIEMYSQPYPPEKWAAIQKHYPLPFDEEGVELVPWGYDPKNIRDVFFCGGVLGIASLTEWQKAKLRKDFLQMYRDEYKLDLIAEDYDGDDSVTIDEIVSGYNPFTQGTPEYPCPNPECENHAAGTRLPVLAYLEPEPDDPFYKSIMGGDSGQLIWLVCERCGGVVVTNPIT